MYKLFFILFLCFVPLGKCLSQEFDDSALVRRALIGGIDSLTDTAMHGRGYVFNGREIAAKFLIKEFGNLKLKYAGRKKSYVQSYSFPVNTFPGKMDFMVGKRKLVPGVDFLIDAASHSFSGVGLSIEHKDISKINGNEDWEKMCKGFQVKGKVYVLENIDSACKKLGIRKHYLPYILPKGCFIIMQKEKFTWTVEVEHTDATVFYVKPEALPDSGGLVDVQVQARWFSGAKSKNIIGVVPGEVKDTFVVFSAHYDHLGMMGNKTVFPGASDNASGTSMLLYLARYFTAHPSHYSVAFIAFSGEEAGLLGSEYFNRHPKMPLNKIKFLVNMDITGDATDGITVVNATEFPEKFKLMQEINKEKGYLPKVVSRGKASNSDHYFFTENGVPSFFIYSNGGKGFYHDINDKPEEVTLNKIPALARFLIDFAHALN